ncbi:hypothetical protein K466DRAFT_626800, partial [Polyporus arcularius HHB13444]
MIALGFAFSISARHCAGTIHVFGDSRSALETIFKTTVHGQQSVSVRTCTILNQWLDAAPQHRVELHWIPSHTGIRYNELIDEDVKGAAADDGTSLRSYLSLRAAAKADALASWRTAAHIGTPPPHS